MNIKDIKEYLFYLLDKVLKKPNVDNGFIEEIPKPEDWQYDDLGSKSKKKIVLNSGQHDKYLPEMEVQKIGKTETMGCVSFSWLNVIEFAVRRMILDPIDEIEKKIVRVFNSLGLIKNEFLNDNDRILAQISGTTRSGNSQKRVAEAKRTKSGSLREEEWPFIQGWNKYYAPVPEVLLEKARKIYKYIEFNYEWVHPANFKDALKRGVLQVSGYAWPHTINSIYQRTENRRNHAFVIYGYEEGKYWKAFDSYNHTGNNTKKLAWNFNFGWGMLCTINLKKEFNEVRSLNELLNIYQNRAVKGMGEKVYLVKNNKKHHIQDEETAWVNFIALWYDVEQILDEEIKKIPEGEPLKFKDASFKMKRLLNEIVNSPKILNRIKNERQTHQ